MAKAQLSCAHPVTCEIVTRDRYLRSLRVHLAQAWNFEGERLLRASSVEYTIVRPGVMSPAPVEPSSLVVADDGGDLKVSRISYAAIAALCVESLGYTNAARSTLCAMTVAPGEGAESWHELLGKVAPDRRTFAGDELFPKQLLAVRLGGAALVGAGFAAAATLLGLAARLVGLVTALLL